MPTPSERRALLFVAAVAALGLGVRGARTLRGEPRPPHERAALAAQIAAVDSAVTAGGRPRRQRQVSAKAGQGSLGGLDRARDVGRPGAAGRAGAVAGPVDVDRADAAALDGLPGIGPALARRIVEDREARGAFGSLEGLQQVRGIGPALAAKVAPFVTFSGRPRALARP